MKKMLFDVIGPQEWSRIHNGSSHFKTFKNRNIEQKGETKQKEKNEPKKLLNIHFRFQKAT